MTHDPQRHYELAQRTLDLDPARDKHAAKRLARLLQAAEVIDPETLRDTFQNKTVTILGPVPGGAESIDPAEPFIAAGSSVRQALSAGIQPPLIVSDLDGSDMAHKMFSRVDTATAVHAHGDNIHLLENLLPQLEGPLFGTTQTPPPDRTRIPIHRYGGFTDGDRACFIAQHLGADRLRLVGWNLDEPITGDPKKATKLDLAERLLEDLEVPLSFVEPDPPSTKSLHDLDLGDGIGLEVGDEPP